MRMMAAQSYLWFWLTDWTCERRVKLLSPPIMLVRFYTITARCTTCCSTSRVPRCQCSWTMALIQRNNVKFLAAVTNCLPILLTLICDSMDRTHILRTATPMINFEIKENIIWKLWKKNFCLFRINNIKKTKKNIILRKFRIIGYLWIFRIKISKLSKLLASFEIFEI